MWNVLNAEKQIAITSSEKKVEPKKNRKPGRPKLPRGNAKAGYLRVRLTANELRAIEAAAKANGQTVSEWVRGKINATSQR